MEYDDLSDQHELMPISREGIAGALAKAERYRYLNEPSQAESICRDVLAVDPANQSALILLILASTDQFQHGLSPAEALRLVETLTNEYNRAYYSGMIHEREAIATFRRHNDFRSRKSMRTLIQKAMDFYRHAGAIRPPENDEATLRWNACVRFLERNWGLR